VCQQPTASCHVGRGLMVNRSTGQSGALRTENQSITRIASVALFTVWCAPDSPVHPRRESNQGLPIGAPMAPRSLRAIKGTPRCMELNTKHPLNIIQHRDFASTQLFHCDRDLSTSSSCDSAVLFRVLFS
jgi:hypothetical protein